MPSNYDDKPTPKSEKPEPRTIKQRLLKLLGGGQARRAGEELNDRKSKLDKAIKKQTGNK